MDYKQLRQLRWLPGEILRTKAQLEVMPKIPEFTDRSKALTSHLEQCLQEYEEGMNFIESVPDSHLRQILNLHFAEGMSYRRVCAVIGGGNTPEGLRKQCTRYLSKCQALKRKGDPLGKNQ